MKKEKQITLRMDSQMYSLVETLPGENINDKIRRVLLDKLNVQLQYTPKGE